MENSSLRLIALAARIETLLDRGEYLKRVTGEWGTNAPARHSAEAGDAAGKLRTYRQKPITRQVEAVKKQVRKEGRKVYGPGVAIASHGASDAEYFPARHPNLKVALDNLDKQAAKHGIGAFQVVRNGNNIPLVRETRKLPFYHIV